MGNLTRQLQHGVDFSFHREKILVNLDMSAQIYALKEKNILLRMMAFASYSQKMMNFAGSFSCIIAQQ